MLEVKSKSSQSCNGDSFDKVTLNLLIYYEKNVYEDSKAKGTLLARSLEVKSVFKERGNVNETRMFDLKNLNKTKNTLKLFKRQFLLI